jgi:peptidoglycan/xylan/chitin deacetylase (PgdA/CDA1 family)
MKNFFMNFIRGRGAILNYHRVLPLEKIDNSLVNISVSIENFINQLSYLRDNFEIISLDSLLLHLSGKSNKFKLAITFDDGYRDNLDFAFPILKKFNIPATIYVATKFINNQSIPWWIILDDFIKNNKDLDNNKKNKFNYFKNKILFRNQNEIDKNLLLITKKDYKLNHSRIFLSFKEIKYLSDEKLITIGSHSHSHYNFSKLTKTQTLNELIKSKSILEKITKKKVLHFAYPYGGYDNINFKYAKLLKNAGYLSAVTTIRKKLDNYDQFLLPRIFINEDKNLLRLKLKLFGFRKFSL